MMTPRTALIVGALVLVPAFSASAAIPEPVRTEGGQVTGIAGAFPEVRVFKGLPFAAPPVGERRWRAPEPPAKWDGVRAADRFSANCMQRSANGAAFPPYGGDRSATTMSEDCLYLNVYTAAAAATEKRPVMVWIHGGAYTSGAGAIYEGEELARKGVVVVTVNYRLGVFGFLAHPELSKESPNHVSGNYAFLDQIAALRWVQKNIAAFGGDPSRVTIFGESAGSWSVNNLVATPLSKGLFQRAIGESGAQFTITRTLSAAEQAGTRFAEGGGAATLVALRGMSGQAVNDLQGFQTSATVDGYVFPTDVLTIFKAGKQNDVPTLIGSNSDEGSIFTRDTTTLASFHQQIERQMGPNAEAYLKLYPAATDQEARKAQAASMRDQTFGWEMRTWARLQTQTGKSKVYLYYLSQAPPLENAAWLGAQHGAEIPYAFNWPNGKWSSMVPWTAADKAFAEQVSSYWVNFATTGDPNGKGLPTWTPYSAKDNRAMALKTLIEMVPVPHNAALDFLDEHNARVRAGEPGSAGRTRSGGAR